MKPVSISNRQLTLLRKLNRKKYRKQKQLFVLEGSRAVQQVLDNKSITVEGLFFDENQQYWQREGWKNYKKNMDCAVIPSPSFSDVTDTQNPQGVLALCVIPQEQSVAALASQNGVIVALDAIRDPGNLGTIIRSASWFGVQALLLGKGTVDLFHPKVVRSTAGATGSIPHITGKLPVLLRDFEALGWPVLLLDTSEQAILLSQVHVASKTIMVIGNEAHGINAELAKPDFRKVKIPSRTGNTNVESLNAGVAASIALYEITG